MDQLTLLIHS